MAIISDTLPDMELHNALITNTTWHDQDKINSRGYNLKQDMDVLQRSQIWYYPIYSTSFTSWYKGYFHKNTSTCIPLTLSRLLPCLHSLPSKSRFVLRFNHFYYTCALPDEMSNFMKTCNTLQIQIITDATIVTSRDRIEPHTFGIEANCSRTWAKRDRHKINH